MYGTNVIKKAGRMKENSNITVRKLSEQIGVGVTTISKHIRFLKENGTIKRNGSRKNRQWMVRDKYG